MLAFYGNLLTGITTLLSVLSFKFKFLRSITLCCFNTSYKYTRTPTFILLEKVLNMLEKILLTSSKLQTAYHVHVFMIRYDICARKLADICQFSLAQVETKN